MFTNKFKLSFNKYKIKLGELNKRNKILIEIDDTANLRSFDLTTDELFDDDLRELNTVLIVNKLNKNIKINGMANS